MVKRTLNGGHPESRVVALWSDHRQRRELALPPGGQGLVLGLRTEVTQQFTADGRKHNVRQLTLGSVEFV